MRKYSKKTCIGKMIVFGVIAVAICTTAFMLLWNWLMPVIFGLTVITFWQALGLLALSKLLFGCKRQNSWRHKMKAKMRKKKLMRHLKNQSLYENVQDLEPEAKEDKKL